MPTLNYQQALNCAFTCYFPAFLLSASATTESTVDLLLVGIDASGLNRYTTRPSRRPAASSEIEWIYSYA